MNTDTTSTAELIGEEFAVHCLTIAGPFSDGHYTVSYAGGDKITVAASVDLKRPEAYFEMKNGHDVTVLIPEKVMVAVLGGMNAFRNSASQVYDDETLGYLTESGSDEVL